MKPASAAASLFEVYLRLRPSQNVGGERFIDVEEALAADDGGDGGDGDDGDDGYGYVGNESEDADGGDGIDDDDGGVEDSGEVEGQDVKQQQQRRRRQRQQQPPSTPTHITIKPPSYDHRKRAVERFAFTRVFEEDASQRDVFTGAGVVPLVAGVLGGSCDVGVEGERNGGQKKQGARDGLLATLGMTGSGKTHTILGSKSQRGLTQMALDVLFQSAGDRILSSATAVQAAFESLKASDPSEAIMIPSVALLDSLSGELGNVLGVGSRAQSTCPDTSSFLSLPTPKRRTMHHLRRSAMPSVPSVQDITVPTDPSVAQYAIVVSMYEVYNDRIFDLLARPPGGTNAPSTPNGNHNHYQNHNQRRRPLLFKFTEASPDRKVVAGLRKVVCASLEEALTVLDTGLLTRKVAGTGSNAVSSRGHGFFVVEVKRRRSERSSWTTGTLTVVDLAGSERARNAKTAGATLAEAGKINESLMYLGQCMQMQSDSQEAGGGVNGHTGSRNIVVPYRQCKLTELLFSNSFVPSTSSSSTMAHHGYRSSQYYGGGGVYGQHQHQQQHQQRVPQRAIMIVTADARGDFNATSQILRYSALAREVTVPRIPSVSSVIQNGGRASPTDIAYPSITVGNAIHGNGASSRTPSQTTYTITLPHSSSPSTSPTESHHPNLATTSDLETETAILRLQLADETTRRRAAESSWLAAEQRLADAEERLATTEDRIAAAEQAVRDEMYVLMEEAVEAERRRWKGAWDEEVERQDEKVDRKIEIMERGGGGGGGVVNGDDAVVDIFVDADDNSHMSNQEDPVTMTASAITAATRATEQQRLAALEQENEGLKVKVRAMERAALNEGNQRDDDCMLQRQRQQRQQQQRTPSRKQRVLTARRWEAEDGLGSSPP